MICYLYGIYRYENNILLFHQLFLPMDFDKILYPWMFIPVDERYAQNMMYLLQPAS